MPRRSGDADQASLRRRLLAVVLALSQEPASTLLLDDGPARSSSSDDTTMLLLDRRPGVVAEGEAGDELARSVAEGGNRYGCYLDCSHRPAEPCVNGLTGRCAWGVKSEEDLGCAWVWIERHPARPGHLTASSIRDVADAMGISHELVRRIEISAIRRIAAQDPALLAGLRGELYDPARPPARYRPRIVEPLGPQDWSRGVWLDEAEDDDAELEVLVDPAELERLVG